MIGAMSGRARGALFRLAARQAGKQVLTAPSGTPRFAAIGTKGGVGGRPWDYAVAMAETKNGSTAVTKMAVWRRVMGMILQGSWSFAGVGEPGSNPPCPGFWRNSFCLRIPGLPDAIRFSSRSVASPASPCHILAFDPGSQFFRLAAGLAQAVHSCAQLGLGLTQLVGDLGLALLQIDDGLIAGLFGLVQGLRHLVQFADLGLGYARKAVDDPTGEPTKTESHEKDNRRGQDEFVSVQLMSLAVRP
jgi:hypothetical protein